MAVAVLHVAIAAVQYRGVLATVVQRGVFDTVAGDPQVGAVVWSMLFGIVAFIGGSAVAALERSGIALPGFLGWCLLVLAILGSVLVPVSGFWLILPPAIGVLFKQSSARLPTSGR